MAFSGSVSVTIARRGGTAFLQFRDREEAEREFRRGNGVVVRGCRVVVMYSHSLGSKGSFREDLSGIWSQKRVEREYDGKMRDYRDRGRRMAYEDRISRSRFNMKRSKTCSRSRSRTFDFKEKNRRQEYETDDKGGEMDQNYLF